MEEYVMSNGFAVSSHFSSTQPEAVLECEKSSRIENTRNWLYKVSGNKQEEIGYTVKRGPLDWKFVFVKK